jgi:hypothetical protein
MKYNCIRNKKWRHDWIFSYGYVLKIHIDIHRFARKERNDVMRLAECVNVLQVGQILGQILGFATPEIGEE